MKIGLNVLREWIDLPDDPRAVRRLLDECGLEVKRFDDGVFTLELLANRGDHYCYEGVARELHGRLGTASGVRAPAVPTLETGSSPWDLRCETPLCLVYTATLLEGPGTALSERALQPLTAAGIHSVSAPVDATNLANLELGQPTHAFDADTIEGPVVIRTSRAGERAWPLFAPEPVAVPEGTLVIADDRKILAIAGVIGCEESKTTERTTRLLLESACFDPVAVRKASRALRIHTDSSARFERGADPERPLVGAGRVVDLLEREAGWRRVGATGVVGEWRDPGRVVSVDAEAVSEFLGVTLAAAEVAERLGRYGFRCRVEGERVHAAVPSWRLWDVELPADVYEELAKSIGYDNTPTHLPMVELGALPSPAERKKERVEDVLLGNGFYEVVTDGFYGRAALAMLGVAEGHPLARHVETTNALDRAYSLLKNNTLHQALLAVADNERRRTLDVKMYEWTRTFHPIDAVLPERPDPRQPPCVERQVLWLAVSGRDRPKGWQDTSRPADVFYLKGLLGELGTELGLALEAVPLEADHLMAPFLHPGRRAAVRLNGEPAGVFGEVHPALARRYKLKHSRPCWLELEVSALLIEGARPAFEEPSDVQPLTRALAFDLPDRVEAGDVATCMRESGPDWLDRVKVVDLYAHDGLRAVTFEVRYTNPEGARSAEEVNAVTEALVKAVLERFGPRGVRQR